MPTTPATFDNFQLEATDYRQFLTQAEQIGARGVVDPAQPVVRRLDVHTDGDGFDPDQRFSEKMADGLDALLSVALVGDEGTFGGNLTARYRELRLDMPALCGVDNMVSKTTLPDGRIKEVWKFPEGPRKIQTLTAWFGIASKCWLLQYGKLKSLVLESERTGETAGNKSYHFNAAVRNQQFPAYAFVAQNEKYTLAGNGGSGGLTLSYTLPGSATPRVVTLLPTDTALQIKAKFEAFADGVSVNVAGNLGAVSEVQTLATGAGFSAASVPVGVVNPLTGVAGTANITPGDSLATIGSALSSAIGAAGSVTATGTSTAASGTSALIADPTSAPSFVGGGPAWAGPSGSYQVAYSYANANGETKLSPAFAFTATQGQGGPGSLNGANAGAGTLVKWYVTDAPGSTTFRLQTTNNSASNFPAFFPTVPPANTQPLASTSNTTQSNGTPGSLALSFAIGGTLAGINVSQFTSATPGVTLATPTQGGVTGTSTVEFASPANTRVVTTKTAGDALITLAETQFASDGSGPMEITGPEIQPNQWLVYKGLTKADLDAINMGDASTPRDTATSKLVKTAHGQTVSFENLAQAVYLEDGKVNPGTHVTRRPTVTSSLTVAVQQVGAQDFAEDIYATEQFGGCGVNPFWLRYCARCLQDEIWIDGKWARNQKAAHPVAEGLAQWQFPLTRIRDKSGSMFLTFIYPAS